MFRIILKIPSEDATMRQVTLGRTGLKIAPLIYGTLTLGPLQANLSPQDGGRLIRFALERGVNLLDTAELYATYPHIRAALDGYAGEVQVASKTHAGDAATARLHVETGLRVLGREAFEIVHIHGATLQDPFVEREGVFHELLKMREEGKLRFIGLSGHYIKALRKALEQPEIAVVHPLINQAGRGIRDGSAAEMAALIHELSRVGKGVYAMKALAGGNLISQARASINYVTSLPGVDALAIGMSSEEQILANLDLVCRGEGSHPRWERLEAERRQIKIMTMFCKGCGNCVPECTNNALRIVDGKAIIDEESCLLCGYCAPACPEFMIRIF